MYCPKCGMEQPNDSQFCRNCGQGQSVASTSGSAAAAAVAPARISPPSSRPRPQSNAEKWVLVLALVAICIVGAKVYLDSLAHQSLAAQPAPPLLHKVSIPTRAFTVSALAANNFTFPVPAGAVDVSMKGHFAATGGLGNDIEVVVVSEDEFVNWRNGHPSKAFYNSGRVTQDTIKLNLPSDAATYYVVFSNKFSLFTPKAVEADVDVNFYTR
jgi:hypothetical protein